MIIRAVCIFFTFIACICFLSACSNHEITPKESTTSVITDPHDSIYESIGEPKETNEQFSKEETQEEHLYDNKELYNNQDNYSVITMYLTVSKGNTGDSSFHTWKEINTFSSYDYKKAGTERYKVEGILQIDETGNGITESSFGYGESIPNVSVQVRGQSSSLTEQKNYKVRIKDGRGEFRGQRTLDLNKHMNEAYRFANKLCYDLANSTPQIIGGRTQFVHLFVKDQTVNNTTVINQNEGFFEDYGLYTMVEQVNRTYLKNHGFDENGQLYKVTFFEWENYNELMIDQDDPLFDQDKFDEYLESKVNNDHSNLRQTLTELHNYSIPINQIIDNHFDVENLMYFMAFNILNGNADVGARNLFLYSPLNSKKIYFICWDMDSSFQNNFRDWENDIEGKSWEQGMTKFLGLTLINRMMKEEMYRDLLTDAVNDLYRNYLNPDIVQLRADKYAAIVKPFLFSEPDFKYSDIKSEALYDDLVSRFGDEVKNNYKIFEDSMKCPWPFYVDLPTIDYDNNETVFSWGASYNYGKSVTYDYILATDYDFKNILDEGHNLTVPIATSRSLSPGIYFLKVTATNTDGYTTDCFDYVRKETNGKSYGCFCFVVKNDGKVANYIEEQV